MRLSSPDHADFRQLAQWLHAADALVEHHSDGEMLSGSSTHDLPLIQRVLDAHPAQTLQPGAVQALAVALGRALLHAHDCCDWVIVEGARHRGFALRRAGTLLWVSPHGSLYAHLQAHAKADAAQVLAQMAQRLNPPALAASMPGVPSALAASSTRH